jgi:hypothetical protein
MEEMIKNYDEYTEDKRLNDTYGILEKEVNYELVCK